MNDQNLPLLIESIAKSARKASLELATLNSEKKNQFLRDLADALEANTDTILKATLYELNNSYLDIKANYNFGGIHVYIDCTESLLSGR